MENYLSVDAIGYNEYEWIDIFKFIEVKLMIEGGFYVFSTEI